MHTSLSEIPSTASSGLTNHGFGKTASKLGESPESSSTKEDDYDSAVRWTRWTEPSIPKKVRAQRCAPTQCAAARPARPGLLILGLDVCGACPLLPYAMLTNVV